MLIAVRASLAQFSSSLVRGRSASAWTSTSTVLSASLAVVVSKSDVSDETGGAGDGAFSVMVSSTVSVVEVESDVSDKTGGAGLGVFASFTATVSSTGVWTRWALLISVSASFAQFSSSVVKERSATAWTSFSRFLNFHCQKRSYG